LVADFVVCRPDYSVVAVIELDDRSHRSEKAQERDQRKTRAIEAAGLRLVRIPAGPLPAAEEIEWLLKETVAATPAQWAPRRTASSDSPFHYARPWRAVMGGAVLVGVGCAFYVALQGSPMVVSKRAVVLPVASITVPTVRPSLPRSEDANAAEAATQQRSDAARALASQQVADALIKRKEVAWAQYFTVSASCEHPATWDDQVACGNRYMRARKEFEQRWSTLQVASR
jgi:Protein of unknown function (DUF2726)